MPLHVRLLVLASCWRWPQPSAGYQRKPSNRVRSFARYETMAQDYWPTWSPDGRQVIFVRRMQLTGRDTLNIFLVSASCGTLQAVSATPARRRRFVAYPDRGHPL